MQRVFYFSNSLLNFFISSSSAVEIFSLSVPSNVSGRDVAFCEDATSSAYPQGWGETLLRSKTGKPVVHATGFLFQQQFAEFFISSSSAVEIFSLSVPSNVSGRDVAFCEDATSSAYPQGWGETLLRSSC